MGIPKLTLNYPNIQDERGQLHSIADPTLYLTFGQWIYLVPQYKPESVLVLGYGGGTCVQLTKMFYGNVPITAVDIADCSEFNHGVELIQANARDYVKTSEKFDCVVIDLFEPSKSSPPAFVFEEPFISDVKKIANYVIVHCGKDDDMSKWGKPLRVLSTNDGMPNEPRFYYFMINEVHRLPVR